MNIAFSITTRAFDSDGLSDEPKDPWYIAPSDRVSTPRAPNDRAMPPDDE